MILNKCPYANNLLVLPARPEFGYKRVTSGKHKGDLIFDEKGQPIPKKRVVFNPDLKDMFGDDWLKVRDDLEERMYSRHVYPGTGETAELFQVGCGHCMVCRKNHAFEWKSRLLMERELYPRDDDCCFLTLDYNDLFIPRLASGLPTLCHDDVAIFIRNVRDKIQAKDPDARLRFFCAGEYGSSTERSHYHLVLFGYDFFKGAKFMRKSRGGFDLFTNPIFDEAWSKNGVPKGGALFGMFSGGSAMYTAQYTVKKLLSAFDDSLGRKEPYIQMSRRPGIGHDYIIQHKDEILADGGVYLHGEFFPISRYMMKVFISEKVPGIYSIDFDRRRILKERAERLDELQAKSTDLPLWKARRLADEAAFASAKIRSQIKGGL